VPSGARNGIYNATLTVLGIFKDYDEFTVTNATSFEKLSITSIIANNISLGRKASLVAQVQADTEGYVANAQCMVTVLTPFSTVLETQEGTTVGGDGHIVFAFDTEKWSDTVRSYVGEQVDYYLECNCFPNCTAGSYEKGCCVGRVTDGADSKPILNFHFADSFIPVTVTANETEPTATVTLTLLLLSFGIVLLYIWLGTVWAIEIFNPKERQNIVKVLFMWLGLWLIPLILNIILILLDYAGIGTKLVDMFTLLYDISMWVDYIVTAIMIIFLVYNSVIWLSTAFGNKGRQK
jgi:hypothetical protein